MAYQNLEARVNQRRTMTRSNVEIVMNTCITRHYEVEPKKLVWPGVPKFGIGLGSKIKARKKLSLKGLPKWPLDLTRLRSKRACGFQAKC